jgi:hypothetical protein
MVHFQRNGLESFTKLLSSPIKVVAIKALQCLSNLSSDIDVSAIASFVRDNLGYEKDSDILDVSLESSILLFSKYDWIICSDAESLLKCVISIIKDYQFKPTIVSKAICLSGRLLSIKVRHENRLFNEHLIQSHLQ